MKRPKPQPPVVAYLLASLTMTWTVGAGDKGSVRPRHRHMLPGELDKDRAVRERQRPLLISLHGDVVTENAHLPFQLLVIGY